MRLVNCPVCGTRCSSDTESCPNCDFEIYSYFNVEKKAYAHPKKNIILIFCIVSIVAVCSILLVFLIHRNNISAKVTSSDIKPMESVFPSKVSETDTVVRRSLSEAEAAISGVYSGDDHEILVLANDGLAYYYCFSSEFTELECPWYAKDGYVYIELARLHCTISAKISDKEMLFSSDSTNWNTELFLRLDVEPEQYLTKSVKTYDPNAVMNPDGTISYTLDDITYTLPKSFIDYEDDFDKLSYCSEFTDEDMQNDYVSTILFLTTHEKPINDNTALKLGKAFAANFCDSASIDSYSTTYIAGHFAYIYGITGYLNSGFNRIKNYKAEGYIVMFYNEYTKNNDYILLIQCADRNIDDTDKWSQILTSPQNPSPQAQSQ